MSRTNTNQLKNGGTMEVAYALATLGESNISHSVQNVSSNTKVLEFPKTLMDVMDYADEMNANCTEASSKFCVTWLADGKSFLVRDPAEFTRTIIPKFFKPSKFTSFARKLYRWGFRQFTSLDTDGTAAPVDAVAFSAPFFDRNAKHELSKMKSVSSASERKRKTAAASAIAETKQGRHSIGSFASNTDDREASDSSSETSQGPLKRRKLRQSAISPITDEDYDRDSNGKAGPNNELDGRSNFNMPNFLMPMQAFSGIQPQASGNNASTQVNANSGSDALLQALLVNNIGNIGNNNNNNNNMAGLSPVIANKDPRMPPYSFQQPQSQSAAQHRRSSEATIVSLQGAMMQNNNITNNNSMMLFANQANNNSGTNSQTAALLQQLASSMPAPQPIVPTAPFAAPVANQAFSSLVNNLIAQHSRSAQAKAAQAQGFASTYVAMMGQQQQQQQQQHNNDLNAAVSYLTKFISGRIP